MKIDNKILTLVNIYAPNNDNPTCFHNVIDRIIPDESEEVVVVVILYLNSVKNLQ